MSHQQVNRDFGWQTEYRAFTVSYSNVEVIKQYIIRQEEHHHKQTFQEEWDHFRG